MKHYIKKYLCALIKKYYNDAFYTYFDNNILHFYLLEEINEIHENKFLL